MSTRYNGFGAGVDPTPQPNAINKPLALSQEVLNETREDFESSLSPRYVAPHLRPGFTPKPGVTAPPTTPKKRRGSYRYVCLLYVE